MDTKWAGKVLQVWSSYNFSMDLDYYSGLAWDPEAGRTVTISINESDYRTGADATPEIVAEANAWWIEQEVERTLNKAIQEATYVCKGREVEVVRGRKVPKGTKGKVFWIGEGNWGYRVGFNTADGETVWTAASNVEVVNPEQFEITEAQAREIVSSKPLPWSAKVAA